MFERQNEMTGEGELVINGCVFDLYTFGAEMGFDFDGTMQQFSPFKWGLSGLPNGAKSPPPRLD